MHMQGPRLDGINTLHICVFISENVFPWKKTTAIVRRGRAWKLIELICLFPWLEDLRTKFLSLSTNSTSDILS